MRMHALRRSLSPGLSIVGPSLCNFLSARFAFIIPAAVFIGFYFAFARLCFFLLKFASLQDSFSPEEARRTDARPPARLFSARRRELRNTRSLGSENKQTRRKGSPRMPGSPENRMLPNDASAGRSTAECSGTKAEHRLGIRRFRSILYSPFCFFLICYFVAQNLA